MTDWTSYNEFIARYNIDTVVSMVAYVLMTRKQQTVTCSCRTMFL